MPALLVCFFAQVAAAQASGVPASFFGTVTNVTALPGMPPGSCSAVQGGGQYNRNFDSEITNCFTATIHNCPNVADINFVFGYGVPTTAPPYSGTIVYLTGDGGLNGGDAGSLNYYAQYYTQHGYQLVEVAWGDYTTKGTPWEEAWPLDLTSNPSFLFASCRVATFLNYIRNGNYPNVGQGIWSNTQGGMCTHANSGGSGGAAYALTWYGAGAGGAASWGSGYIDKAVFENGPVYSNVEEGCYVNASGQSGYRTTICPAGGNQIGCNWTVSSSYSLEYATGTDASSVNLWSGATGPACANNTVNNATTFNSQWQGMSIVGGSAQGGGPGPSINYPATAISAWLCASVLNNGALNNSMSQGQLFYEQFISTSQLWNGQLSVNGVINCPTTEDVEHGSVTAGGINYPQLTAYKALEADMTSNLAAPSCAAMGGVRASQN